MTPGVRCVPPQSGRVGVLLDDPRGPWYTGYMPKKRCTKKRFNSWEAANLELCKILQRGIRDPEGYIEKRAYRCRGCGGYHLTSWQYKENRIRW
jgi:hypothetical protein